MAPDGNEDPIRAEIFSAERLEQFARELAAEHKSVVRKKGRAALLPRLEDNGRKLVASYRAPDVVRFGLSPLYHRYADIWALGERLRQLETVRMQ